MEGGSGMGLFDKKNCDICGEKIGILGKMCIRDRTRAQGRAYRIEKRTSHITIVLDER